MSDTPAKPHSAEYFGEQRDFWWNADFVALMARRWQLDRVHRALDLWAVAGAVTRETADALRAGTEHTAGGGMTYLISGRKPR